MANGDSGGRNSIRRRPVQATNHGVVVGAGVQIVEGFFAAR
jgi:hypothetical protein